MVVTVSELLLKGYLDAPGRDALVVQHAGKADRVLTRAELLSGAAAYARLYAQAGIAPGEVVVLILQHGVDLVCAFFGAVLNGAVPAILPFLTEKLQPERYRSDLAALVKVTQPAAILTYPEFRSEVAAALEADGPVRVLLDSGQVGPPKAPDFEALPGMRRQADDLVLLQHSSGTTGLQKGVALSHVAVLRQLAAYGRALNFDPQRDVVVSWLPLYHDMGLIAGFLMPLLLGAKLVLLSPFDWVRAPGRLLAAVSRYRGTLSWLPNFAYPFCAGRVRERELEGLDLSSWRMVINCSEPVHIEAHRTFLERFASYGLRAEALGTCYAMAENVFAVTQSVPGRSPAVDVVDGRLFQEQRVAERVLGGKTGDSANSGKGLLAGALENLSSGRLLPNVQARVLDEAGNELPERRVGEIALRSDCLLSGYYHRPDATASAFRDGWYLTGDYGYLADGELYVSGRKKDLIIVGGKNVYPQDLEALAMQISGVHAGRVAAFGVYNSDAGTEEVAVVAEVDAVDRAEREPIAEAIRRNVTQGSDVALRRVLLVEPGWLIKTSSGKVARSANREKYLQFLQQESSANG